MAKKTAPVAKTSTRGTAKPAARKAIPPKTKRIRRTRSIERTIEEAREFEDRHRKRHLKTTLSRRRSDAKDKKAPAPAPKAAPKRKLASSRPSRPARPSLPAVPAVAPAAPPAPVPVTTYSQPKRNKGTVLGAKKDDKARPLPAFGVIEVCFCIDATGSMSSYLAQTKSAVVSLISKIEEKVHSEGIELRFAVVTYRDHPPQDSTYVTKIQDFTNDKEIRDYINGLDAFGGGDEPEAAHDGLLHAANNVSWTNTSHVPTVRYVFHIADAPAHGSEFLTGEKQKGCTCGISTDAVIHAVNAKEIHYRLIKVYDSNPRLNEMGSLFKKFMTNCEETTIQKANELDVRISDMVMRELLPDA